MPSLFRNKKNKKMDWIPLALVASLGYISWVTNQADTSESTRERIIEAARQAFHDRGYAETSLQDIAERAHARGGSLYYFFKTKESLLAAVLDEYKTIMRPVLLDPIWKDC